MLALTRVLPAIALALLVGCPTLPLSAAAECSNPDALGVSRVVEIDPGDRLEVGSSQYPGILPLGDMEVVLTFDDGPYPGRTDTVLAALAVECARATFFVTGQMAHAHPGTLAAIAASGHTIGTHTDAHPLDMRHLDYATAVREIDRGIARVTAALGYAPAPFFRFPGLAHTRALRDHLAALHIAVFSADIMGNDWTPIGADAIRARVITGLLAWRGGIVLLHDTKLATGAMLPALLRDLKANGFHLVHIVPPLNLRLIAAAPQG
jgi:peptidoglycan/xylan/chitin deacetylase (PgdA/CDA1 family)